MDLSQWLVAELADNVARLRGQVMDLVPPERRSERPGGGNSVLWGALHMARHADLALMVVSDDESPPSTELHALGPVVSDRGNGLQELQQPWAEELSADRVDAYLTAVVERAARFVAGVTPELLEIVPDVPAGLHQGGIDVENFGWLYNLWQGQPVAFFVRWPLIGHIGNHVGEMIATRNRMGLSPF